MAVSHLKNRLTKQLASRGVKGAEGMAMALMTKRGQVKDGKLTTEGKKRQQLGAAGRAKDRSSSSSKHKPSDFKYSSKTNRATLRKGK